jgi:hypothetical protein
LNLLNRAALGATQADGELSVRIAAIHRRSHGVPGVHAGRKPTLLSGRDDQALLTVLKKTWG